MYLLIVVVLLKGINIIKLKKDNMCFINLIIDPFNTLINQNIK